MFEAPVTATSLVLDEITACTLASGNSPVDVSISAQRTIAPADSAA
ncbi:unannotated protein [freshwater metagenome]|uniref:Unannotated protein n=1 Tax=freshwater metagenome TaxID=449393 RepID=A0A6J6VX50_9ZZZZ